MRKLVEHFSIFSFSFCLFILTSNADEGTYLERFLEARRSRINFLQVEDSWTNVQKDEHEYFPVFIAPQDGLMQTDKISKLPGQPDAVDFDQYSGYVTVDQKAGRALFYYFVESPTNSSTKPLVLWLNGGPGCSSLGGGALGELGPFRVNSDGRTLFRNNYAWNNVANVIFLESPAGVGFSYSNTSGDYDKTGDKSTANDAYTFLINWLERFPQYKTREFYITGESYAGHYVPQLAYRILINNKNSTTPTLINLKGIAIGNALVDDISQAQGKFDYFWTHGLNSDETHKSIFRYCDFVNGNYSDKCYTYLDQSHTETGDINDHNIYSPICLNPSLINGSNGSIYVPDPCFKVYVNNYLNLAEVQENLHALPITWKYCRGFPWTDSPVSVLPVIQNLMDNGVRVWLYSGDVDPIIPVTSTRYAINSLKLPIENAWRPWYSGNEVGGYVVGYKGLALVTVRGSGHYVPKDQPQRSLSMISAFLQGILPPSQS